MSVDVRAENHSTHSAAGFSTLAASPSTDKYAARISGRWRSSLRRGSRRLEGRKPLSLYRLAATATRLRQRAESIGKKAAKRTACEKATARTSSALSTAAHDVARRYAKSSIRFTARLKIIRERVNKPLFQG